MKRHSVSLNHPKGKGNTGGCGKQTCHVPTSPRFWAALLCPRIPDFHVRAPLSSPSIPVEEEPTVCNYNVTPVTLAFYNLLALIPAPAFWQFDQFLRLSVSSSLGCKCPILLRLPDAVLGGPRYENGLEMCRTFSTAPGTGLLWRFYCRAQNLWGSADRR